MYVSNAPKTDVKLFSSVELDAILLISDLALATSGTMIVVTMLPMLTTVFMASVTIRPMLIQPLVWKFVYV